jgi:aryl-alcohol dehydrogenase-like predicted oxidoreductase
VTGPEPSSPAQLVLGTAQWGMAYGIANRHGQSSTDEVREILEVARAGDVRILDTARAYGQSEEVIGSLTADDPYWRIITKISPELPDDEGAIVAKIKASLAQSRRALARDQLETVLLHRPDQLTRGDGAAWRHLLRQRQDGKIKRLGVSVQTPEQALELLDHPQVESLQVPFNLLDQRLRRANFFEQAKAARKEIFVRSVFLQGLAFLPRKRLDASLEPLRVPLGALDRWARDHELSLAGLFLRYARAQGLHLVLGCESAEQLRQNLATWRLGALAADHIQEVEALVPELPAALLDPAQWQLSGLRTEPT